jgi:hypothetical protein
MLLSLSSSSLLLLLLLLFLIPQVRMSLWLTQFHRNYLSLGQVQLGWQLEL